MYACVDENSTNLVDILLRENIDEQSGFPKLSVDHEIQSSGKGFNVDEIAEGLRTSWEEQESHDRDVRNYRRLPDPGEKNSEYEAYLDADITPSDNAVHVFHFTENTIDKTAQEIASYLQNPSNYKPKDLAKHTIGWGITTSHNRFRQGIVPMMDPEGVQMYNKADEDLTAAINSYYGHGHYTGD